MFVNTREGICEGLFFCLFPSVIVILFRGTAVYLGLRKYDTIALDFVVAITTVAVLLIFFSGHLNAHENPKMCEEFEIIRYSLVRMSRMNGKSRTTIS